MKNLLQILFFTLLISCSSKNSSAKKSDNIKTYQKQHLTEVIEFESSLNSADISSCCCITISESLFPNDKKYDLESPFEFYNIDETGYTITTEYFYSSKDSIVRAIIYEWNWPIYKKTIKKQLSLENRKSEKLYEKYLSISTSLKEQLGMPSQYDIYEKEHYRESHLWNVPEKSKAYLFILGDSDKEFYRLRLITYE